MTTISTDRIAELEQKIDVMSAQMDLLVEEHIAGRFDHAYRLWSLLVLELWQRRWLDDQ